MANKKSLNKSRNFHCSKCNYFTCSSKDYNKHCLTKKHTMLTNANDLSQLSQKNNNLYTCICGNIYKHMSSLCKHKHKNKCEMKNNIVKDCISPNEMSDKDLIIMLVKQNSKLMEQNNELVDILKNNNQQISHNTNSLNNNNNKTFNLQFFLNETCKDAMNINDFVSSIQMNLEDLEHTGRQGYIEGISNIIIKNLNKIEHHLRPLHCSDFKREVLYIKDNNEWTKETEDKPILTKAIKTIANENIKQINEWKYNYPDCTKSDSNKNDLYLKIVSNSMNGLTKEEGNKNITKIITNVAKKVIIEK